MKNRIDKHLSFLRGNCLIYIKVTQLKLSFHIRCFIYIYVALKNHTVKKEYKSQ